jgi:hypothetical protein
MDRQHGRRRSRLIITGCHTRRPSDIPASHRPAAAAVAVPLITVIITVVIAVARVFFDPCCKGAEFEFHHKRIMLVDAWSAAAAMGAGGLTASLRTTPS